MKRKNRSYNTINTLPISEGHRKKEFDEYNYSDSEIIDAFDADTPLFEDVKGKLLEKIEEFTTLDY